MHIKEKKIKRAPIITIAGHIDHGKTTLLNYLRNVDTKIKEHGGITQNVNAFNIKTKYGYMTFIDTPGHLAFNSLRIKSIQNSDIMLLILAIDDGIKPQTIESVEIAKKHNVPIIVCINKIDKLELLNKKDKIITELSKFNLIHEEWGGDTFFSYISSKTGEGIENLIDIIHTQADLLDLTYIKDCQANGVILDNKIDNKIGTITSIIIKNGQLKVGDLVKTSTDIGKIKSILDNNKIIKEAFPPMFVNIIGLQKIQEIGDKFECIKKIEKQSKTKHDISLDNEKINKTYNTEDMLKKMKNTNEIKINLILKADLQGSINTLKDLILTLSNDKIKINILHTGMSDINKSDIDLANTTKSIIIGFNNKVPTSLSKFLKTSDVKIKIFTIIYDVIDFLNTYIKDLTNDNIKEIVIGTAEVKKVFIQDKKTFIAGCVVVQGKIKINSYIKIFRKNTLIYKGLIDSIKIFKNQVNEVTQGNECGINIKDYNNIQINDKIKAYITE